jgi:hypothetical protein
MRVAAESVVHSSNANVTRTRQTRGKRLMTAMFHAQPFDIERNSFVGTFFTNLCKGLAFTALRTPADIASTDLSTTRVDKRESPFPSDSCVTYVKQ